MKRPYCIANYPEHVKEAALRLYRRYNLKGHIIARMLKVDLGVTIKPRTVRTWIDQTNRKAQPAAKRTASGSSTAAKSAATARTGATSARPAPSA